MADSPRWCDVHQAYGDHHTDRCPETYGKLTPEERMNEAMREQMRRSGFAPQPAPKRRFPVRTSVAAVGSLAAFIVGNWQMGLLLAGFAAFFYFIEKRF